MSQFTRIDQSFLTQEPNPLFHTKTSIMSHHCAFKNGGKSHVFDWRRCIDKNHTVECPLHPGIAHSPRDKCATCDEVEKSAARRLTAEQAAAKKKATALQEEVTEPVKEKGPKQGEWPFCTYPEIERCSYY